MVAFAAKTVLLLGPVGINRAVGGGPFAPVGGVAAKAHVSDYVTAGSAVFAFGTGTHSLIRSTDEGAKWTDVTVPLAHKASNKHGKRVRASPGVSIRSVAFTSSLQRPAARHSGAPLEDGNGGRSMDGSPAPSGAAKASSSRSRAPSRAS